MRDWWVLKSLRRSNSTGAHFVIFHAAIGRNIDEAILHEKIHDEGLNAELMRLAMERGDIAYEHEWQPISTLIEHISVVRVTTEAEVAYLDTLLLDMLQEHDFFLSEIEEDLATVIGGSWHDAK
jgi:hypothetical protein